MITDNVIASALNSLDQEDTGLARLTQEESQGFCGSTGYLDSIEVAEFTSRGVPALYGKDTYGREYISMLLRQTTLSTANIEDAIKDGGLTKLHYLLERAAAPRVLTVFKRYSDPTNTTWVTGGDAVPCACQGRDQEGRCGRLPHRRHGRGDQPLTTTKEDLSFG